MTTLSLTFSCHGSHRKKGWKEPQIGVFTNLGLFRGGFFICGSNMAFFTALVFLFNTNIHTVAYKPLN